MQVHIVIVVIIMDLVGSFVCPLRVKLGTWSLGRDPCCGVACRLISARKRAAWNASTPGRTGLRGGWPLTGGPNRGETGPPGNGWKAISVRESPESIRRHQPLRRDIIQHMTSWWHCNDVSYDLHNLPLWPRLGYAYLELYIPNFLNASDMGQFHLRNFN